MPSTLGACRILYIAIEYNSRNKFALGIIKQLSETCEDYNSYLYMEVTHEYLHSFGIIDENDVRQMTYDLCRSRSLFGDSHISTLMAMDYPSSIFLELKNMTNHAFYKQFEFI
jgi:hypothetical protein